MQIYHKKGRSFGDGGGDHRGAFCRGIPGIYNTHRASASVMAGGIRGEHFVEGAGERGRGLSILSIRYRIVC
jgi:hypothetical protein